MVRFFITWALLLAMSPVLAQSKTGLNILALGDSYTIGQSVAHDQRWPVQLVRALQQQKIDADVKVIAATGWTTRELEKAIAASQLQLPYDLVTLLIGVNDQFRGGRVDDYQQNFQRLLQASIQYAGGDANKVIVISIPDYGVTPFARRYNPTMISQALDKFNQVNKIAAEKAGAHYVNITPISRQARNDASLLAADGLHPSAKMYAQWVKQLLPVVTKINSKTQ